MTIFMKKLKEAVLAPKATFLAISRCFWLVSRHFRPEEPLYYCPECRGTSVISTRWIYLNGGDVVHTSSPLDYDWCNDCDLEIEALTTEELELQERVI